MIVVTGGLGFIGSNIIKKLNMGGRFDIVIVDDFSDGKLVENVNDLVVSDFIEIKDLPDFLHQNKQNIEVIFHQGAVSDTTCWDGRLVMERNYHFSKKLVDICVQYEITFVYASSASVYGTGNIFRETPECEMPVNLYAYSKLLFDQYVRNAGLLNNARTKIFGLRYFNVYGPRERMKKHMSSPVFKLSQQILDTGIGKLFGGYLDYDAGEQMRDFIYVDDIVDVNLWFWKNNVNNGIYNVGTGTPVSFNELGSAVIHQLRSLGLKEGKLEYIEFPKQLEGFYQSYTKADIQNLRLNGYTADFIDIKEGVRRYLSDSKRGFNLN